MIDTCIKNVINVEAFLSSMNDPQLDRCLESIEKQTVPFSKLTHISGISPASETWNKGWESVTDEWVAILDGDMILYPDALENSLNYMKTRMDPGVCLYCFSLYDPFIEVVDNMFCIARSSVYKNIKAPNKLSFDRYVGAKVKKLGWRYLKHLSLIVGTHFENPTEYQIFTRFSRIHKKYHMRHVRWAEKRLRDLLDRTKDPFYHVALDSMKCTAEYFGSYNVEFDNKRFDEFHANR